jgi:hypothetical protein
MKNLVLTFLVFLAWNFTSAQNIRFSYSVSNPDGPNNQSKLQVKMHNIGAPEFIAGFNYGFYYKSSEATIQGLAAGYSGTLTPAQLAICIDASGASAQGWTPNITGAVTIIAVPPAGLPSGYDRLFIGSIIDDNSTGTEVMGTTPLPMIALILNNSIGTDPINQDSAYQGASDTNPAWVYSYLDLNTGDFFEWPIMVTGARLKTLPIELVSFKAEKSGTRDAFLYWSTASEINSSHFTIQRSYDKKVWSDVGKVDAAGNSQIIENYDFLDVNAYNGIDSKVNVYYRLQMFDLDLRSRYSPMEKVVFGNDATQSSVMKVSLYPNPATDGVYVGWDAQIDNQPTALEMYDVEGKLILTQKVGDRSSKEYIDFGPSKIHSGVYQLRVMNGNETLDYQQIVVGQNR